jgi:hypothetical protein
MISPCLTHPKAVGAAAMVGKIAGASPLAAWPIPRP